MNKDKYQVKNMTALTQLLVIILAAFLIWQLYRFVRSHPQTFSKDNISRSIFTLGILCLLLIAFVALLVLIVKK
jgi:hypothetical protein